jgi:glycosyltransferase involved in cell wall biosynthesis
VWFAGVPGPLLARADALRDARAWAEAARAYAEVLAVAPLAWPIMVQRGHCLKESGDLEGALALYRQAEALAPEDSDVALQIGHVLKLLGRRAEAAAAYARAVRLDPTNADAVREAEALGALPPDVLAGASAPRPGQAGMAPISAAESALSVAPPAAAPSFAAPPQAPLHAAAAPPLPGAAAGSSPAAFAPAAPPAPAAPAESRGEAASLRGPWAFAAAASTAATTPLATSAPAAAAAAPPQLVLDITDLLDHFRRRRTPTGIQRVQIRLSAELLAAPPAGTEITLAAFDPTRLGWVRIPAEECRRLLDLSAAGAAEDDPEWTEAVAAMDRQRARAVPVGIRPGAVLCPLGATWGYADWFRALAEARREGRLFFVPFIHDCVPLRLPETCEEGTAAAYARWFAGFALLADGFLCNSEATRQDVLAELAALSPGLALPGRVVRLDADPRPAVPPAPAAEIPGLRPGEPYVLTVGTIEPRKDHAMLFRAWRALLQRHGAAKLPRLVCAGRIGWQAEPALALLAASAELRRQVLLLENVSDADLAALYRGALFTVYNSRHEGWGLPVTESLAYGKLPLIPRTGALPEAGGEAAVYFAAGSEPELLAALERLIFDPAARAAAEAAIPARARLRPWAEVARELVGALAAVLAAPAPAARGLPRPGPIFAFDSPPSLRPDAARAAAALCREGPLWQPPEAWGVRTLPGAARLRLPLPANAAGAPLRLALDLRAPPKGGRLHLGIAAEGAAALAAEVVLSPGAAEVLLLDLPPAEGEALTVLLDTPAGGEGVGLVAALLCRQDDLPARLAFLEGRRFRFLGEGR